MGKEGKPPPSSGRGGPLGTPGMGDPPDELRPERDPEKGRAISGEGVVEPEPDDEDLS